MGITASLLAFTGHVFGAQDADALFAKHCVACHGVERLGGIGPALLPGNLRRLRKKAAARVIRDGRAASQMPAFGNALGADEIDALVALIYTPPATPPTWNHDHIAASHVVHARSVAPLARPRFDADPMNLFVVVELGDHHATVLDGDRMKPIHRFPTRFALHGGPKYSPSGRFVYFGSRDGWVSKYDLWNLELIAEVRAGINTRNIAVSGDGRYVMAANYLPHTLVLLDAQSLELVKVIPVTDGKGTSSRVSAVYAAPPRRSFIAALKDIPQVWEVSYDENPPKGFSGWVHDYRAESGDGGDIAPFPIRRITLDGILDDFFFDPDYLVVVGAAREGGGQVVDLDAARTIKHIDIDGLPHLGSGITWERGGRTVMASPNLKSGSVTVLDMESWEVVKRIDTLGPGFFLRSHEGSRYAWVDVFFGPDRDAVHVIDKQSLEIVRTLRPAPGKTAAHVEFTRDGKRALLSVWDLDGAIVVYDSDSLVEVKRLPMKKPSGKYNVWNKITRSRGTSH